MNEIKFKILDLTDNTILKGDYRISSINGDVYGKYGEKIENTIALLFTGLKDKNGKEIYEGDIINSYCNAVVCFDNGRFQPRYDGGNAEVVEDDFYRIAQNIEIIGNQFENPELLNM